MKRRVWLYLTVFWLICLVILVKIIVEKYQGNQGAEYRLNREDYMSTQSGGLKYYFELKPNSKIKALISKEGIPVVENTINADGLNERKDYSVKKEPRVFRIITLGDSFTYGLYVPTALNWTELLEDKLNKNQICSNIDKFEVINLGVQGYDSEYSIERFRRKGIKYQPDMVIWYQVDMLRVNELFRERFQKYNEEIANNSHLTKGEKDEMLSQQFSRSLNEVKREVGEDKMIKYQLSSIKKLNKYYSGPVLMIPNPIIRDKFKNAVKEGAKSLVHGIYYSGIRNIDKLGGTFKNDGHPNKDGHQMIAEDLYKYVVDSNLISCDTLEKK